MAEFGLCVLSGYGCHFYHLCYQDMVLSEGVLEEIRHPVRINFFPAFSINLLLLSIVWQQETIVTTILWGTGVVLQVVFTLYVMSSWVYHTHYTLSHANPSWFIPVVGNLIIPITGSQLGYTELSWFCFSIGGVFGIILLTIIMYRLFFHEPLPAHMTPMLFILLAPPSIGFVSYISMVGELDTFARVIYYIALFIGLLLFLIYLNLSKYHFYFFLGIFLSFSCFYYCNDENDSSDIISIFAGIIRCVVVFVDCFIVLVSNAYCKSSVYC